MLAPSTAVFAAASLPPMLAQAAAAANGAQCFGLAMLAVVGAALSATLAHLLTVLAKSPSVALRAQPLFDAMNAKRTSSAILAFISNLAMLAEAAAPAILAPVAPPPMLADAGALAQCT